MKREQYKKQTIGGNREVRMKRVLRKERAAIPSGERYTEPGMVTSLVAVAILLASVMTIYILQFSRGVAQQAYLQNSADLAALAAASEYVQGSGLEESCAIARKIAYRIQETKSIYDIHETDASHENSDASKTTWNRKGNEDQTVQNFSSQGFLCELYGVDDAIRVELKEKGMFSWLIGQVQAEAVAGPHIPR